MPPILDEAPPAAPPEPTTRCGWLFLPLLLLAGYLLFAHGCHGDEDNELFMRLGQMGAVPEK
jgi:hypothetical protein